MSANVSTAINNTQLTNCFAKQFKGARRIGYTFAYCLIFVVSVVGNIFLGVVVYKTKTMRKPINLLIVNMAMFDLLYPLLLFSWVITQMQTNSWLISGSFGEVLCKLVIFLPEVSNAVSIQSLVLIAVDRFGAVVFPLRSPVISSRRCPFFILATWIFAVAIQSPFSIAPGLVQLPSASLMCLYRWEKEFGDASFLIYYGLSNIVILYYVPMVLIIVLYTIIVLKLKTQIVPGCATSVNAEQQRLKRERNVLKMAIAIVSMFVVCFLPLTIHHFLVLFSADVVMLHSCRYAQFVRFSYFLARSNCAINPCICFTFSGNYRQGLKNILSCFSCGTRADQDEQPADVELRPVV
ncbi:neuropeptide SIFamide receptor-like [Stylophora pistillata]|uniref:neuropeptide SIFamide receptor-like n=1 Tax=Stylophora pistillata TaxID=50429 RepID=UPI000C056E63|nr:neuropeptide SIFamide receptor-like [Stylophora pistillata]